MIFPRGITERTSVEKVSEDHAYDAVVGAGIAGSIIALELGRAGKRRVDTKRARWRDRTSAGYQEYLVASTQRLRKTISLRTHQLEMPMPRSSEAHKIAPGVMDASGDSVQTGPFSTDTTYTRVLGGTTMHWEAKVGVCCRKISRPRPLPPGRRLAVQVR